MNNIKLLIEHAQEKYPHFESDRGQKDIENAALELQELKVSMETLIKIIEVDLESKYLFIQTLNKAKKLCNYGEDF